MQERPTERKMKNSRAAISVESLGHTLDIPIVNNSRNATWEDDLVWRYPRWKSTSAKTLDDGADGNVKASWSQIAWQSQQTTGWHLRKTTTWRRIQREASDVDWGDTGDIINGDESHTRTPLSWNHYSHNEWRYAEAQIPVTVSAFQNSCTIESTRRDLLSWYFSYVTKRVELTC